MIGSPTADARTLLLAEQQRDIATLVSRLHEERLENKRLRQRLRTVLNCLDLKCSVCATCLDAVRED